jgi:hypothetical protein
VMSGLIACISAFFSAFSQHRDLALENLALRTFPIEPRAAQT